MLSVRIGMCSVWKECRCYVERRVKCCCLYVRLYTAASGQFLCFASFFLSNQPPSINLQSESFFRVISIAAATSKVEGKLFDQEETLEQRSGGPGGISSSTRYWALLDREY
jgi:hypothetical protein